MKIDTQPSIPGFRTVEFFRDVKERMAKATENMTWPEKQNYWRLLREGKVVLA